MCRIISFFWSSTINKLCDLWPAMYIQLIMLHLFQYLIFDLTSYPCPIPFTSLFAIPDPYSLPNPCWVHSVSVGHRVSVGPLICWRFRRCYFITHLYDPHYNIIITFGAYLLYCGGVVGIFAPSYLNLALTLLRTLDQAHKCFNYSC